MNFDDGFIPRFFLGVSVLSIVAFNTNIYNQAMDLKPILRKWGNYYIEPMKVNSDTKPVNLNLAGVGTGTASCVVVVQG